MKSLKRTSKIQTKIKTVLTQMTSVGVVALIALFLIEASASGFSGSGAGTQAYPYQITNATQLQEMADDLNAHYVLMNDIDCSDTVNWNGGAGFEPIGNSINPFIGTFDGQNHIITGLFINRPSENYVGLFGYVDGAEIKNVGLEDVDISCRGSTGALVGFNVGGKITNSYATGIVTGNSCEVGGLIGPNQQGGTIENCYAKVNVSSHEWCVGGLAASNTTGGIIKNCYATGTATDDLFVGGLVGYTYGGTIENSYSTGSVTGGSNIGGLLGRNSYWSSGANPSTIINCYYNNHAGNPSVGIGFGAGDCTAINDNESYFYDSSNAPMSSWDFVNVWGIDEGVSHPYLLWQIADTTPPTINSISASPDVLWPPNHKMVEVTVTVDCEDICDPVPFCYIVEVMSNEPIDGPGDGNTEPDWELFDDEHEPLVALLRAEHAGGGTGRVYTIIVECIDASGNTDTAMVEVTVPHDQDKGKGKK